MHDSSVSEPYSRSAASIPSVPQAKQWACVLLAQQTVVCTMSEAVQEVGQYSEVEDADQQEQVPEVGEMPEDPQGTEGEGTAAPHEDPKAADEVQDAFGFKTTEQVGCMLAYIYVHIYTCVLYVYICIYVSRDLPRARSGKWLQKENLQLYSQLVCPTACACAVNGLLPLC